MVEVSQPYPGSGIMLLDHVRHRGGLTRLLRELAALLCVPLGLAGLAGWIEAGPTLGIFLLTLAPFYFVARSRLDAFAVAAAIGFLLVGYLPALNHAMEGDWRHVSVMAAVLGFMAIFEILLRKAAGPPVVRPYRGIDLPMLLAWLAIAMVAPAIVSGSMQLLVFVVPFAIALVHFDRLIGNSRARGAATAAFALTLLIYGLFYWNFYGRLLMGAMVAMPLLMLVRYGILRVSPAMLVIGSVPMLWLAQRVRGDTLTGDGIAGSSISGPSQLSVMMTDVLPVLPTRLGDFLDQWLLLFFSWVPKAFWHDKPAGLGWSLVDELTSRRGVSEGHSIAPGLVGESLWLLGDLFVLGFLAQLFAVLLLALLVRRFSHHAGLAAIIIAALLPTLVWGGMASFGARLWLFLFPVFAAVTVMRFLGSNRRNEAV